jgi:hypothetical protein
MLTPKFLRAHIIPASSHSESWIMRVLFEFWGFCVNGDNSLINPGLGAFAPVSGVYQIPWTSQTGLLQSGSDGFTQQGMPFFNTVNATAFSASWVGKYLVTWQSGSTSTDDSIYLITQWIGSSSIRVNIQQGGTPDPVTRHLGFTTRTSINYRVVDINASAQFGLTSQQSALICQFSDAGNINPQQPNSQAAIIWGNPPQGTSGAGFYYFLSPSGSWGLNSGSYNFTDPVGPITFGGGNTGYWSFGNGGAMSLWGAGDFFISHIHNTGQTGSGWHIEIPWRLYPQGVDPNPIVIIPYADYFITLTDGGNHYGGGIYMHSPPDNSLRRYYGMHRRIFGQDDTNSVGFAGNGRFNGAYFNPFNGKFYFSDLVTGTQDTPGQFQLARVRLRRMRALPPIVANFEIIGDKGEWLHVGNGVMWPWDNSLLQYNLFLAGF